MKILNPLNWKLFSFSCSSLITLHLKVKREEGNNRDFEVHVALLSFNLDSSIKKFNRFFFKIISYTLESDSDDDDIN